TTEAESHFSGTTNAMKVSIIEQVCLIAFAGIGLVLKKSDVIKTTLPHRDFVIDVLLVAVFCFAIQILYDTANAVFVIMGEDIKVRSQLNAEVDVRIRIHRISGLAEKDLGVGRWIPYVRSPKCKQVLPPVVPRPSGIPDFLPYDLRDVEFPCESITAK